MLVGPPQILYYWRRRYGLANSDVKTTFVHVEV